MVNAPKRSSVKLLKYKLAANKMTAIPNRSKRPVVSKFFLSISYINVCERYVSSIKQAAILSEPWALFFLEKSIAFMAFSA